MVLLFNCKPSKFGCMASMHTYIHERATACVSHAAPPPPPSVAALSLRSPGSSPLFIQLEPNSASEFGTVRLGGAESRTNVVVVGRRRSLSSIDLRRVARLESREHCLLQQQRHLLVLSDAQAWACRSHGHFLSPHTRRSSSGFLLLLLLLLAAAACCRCRLQSVLLLIYHHSQLSLPPD
jgi:hypothetical protein